MNNKLTELEKKQLREEQGNRLRELRKDQGMSQTEVGDKLMISFSAISKIEKGDREITDRVMVQICDTFNVRKEWLMNGNGNMYKEINDDMIAHMMGKVFADEDDFLKKVFITFASLNDEERSVVKKIINQLSN